jgi:complex III assembly factor LYRM7
MVTTKMAFRGYVIKKRCLQNLCGMSQNLRREVLKAFKSLHKARRHVFEGDDNALTKARTQINQEYKKCKVVTDPEAIRELVAHSRAVENELISTVIQAKEVQPGKYEVRLRDKIVKLDNVPFKDCAQ